MPAGRRPFTLVPLDFHSSKLYSLRANCCLETTPSYVIPNSPSAGKSSSLIPSALAFVTLSGVATVHVVSLKLKLQGIALAACFLFFRVRWHISPAEAYRGSLIPAGSLMLYHRSPLALFADLTNLHYRDVIIKPIKLVVG